MTEETFDSAGQGIDLALPGDTIRKRHIATRASNKRMIVVFVVGDAEFRGYSIGIDSHSLQLLELPSGEVSSIALEYIVSISDGKPFSELTRDEKDTVDRRTASFRKTSQDWLVRNWPKVYDRREGVMDHPERPPVMHYPRVSGRLARADGQARREFAEREKELSTDGDSQVRE